MKEPRELRVLASEASPQPSANRALAGLVERGFAPTPGDAAVRPEALERARALGLDDLDRAFELPAVKRAQANGRWKALAVLDDPAGRVFVKRWDFDRLEVFVRGALKANFPVFSGPREARNLLDLRTAGVRAARPLAAGERTVGRRRRSFVAQEALAGAPLDGPPPAAPAARRALVLAVADLVRRLHAAGFWHKDLYGENVRVDPVEGPGLIDCERVERRAGGPPWRWRVKDLAGLELTVAWATRADRVRFLRRYLGLARAGADGRTLARAVRAKARRMAGRGARW